jgi:motility quorum-sensing regulator/GCU-specific mRNA interferase toxin
LDLRKPSYPLQNIKTLISKECYGLTKRSLDDATSLGFTKTEVGDVILDLDVGDFDKSTTEYYNHKVWQDVYKVKLENVKLYIKFKIVDNGQYLLITSFKKC